MGQIFNHLYEWAEKSIQKVVVHSHFDGRFVFKNLKYKSQITHVKNVDYYVLAQNISGYYIISILITLFCLSSLHFYLQSSLN